MNEIEFAKLVLDQLFWPLVALGCVLAIVLVFQLIMMCGYPLYDMPPPPPPPPPYPEKKRYNEMDEIRNWADIKDDPEAIRRYFEAGLSDAEWEIYFHGLREGFADARRAFEHLMEKEKANGGVYPEGKQK